MKKCLIVLNAIEKCTKLVQRGLVIGKFRGIAVTSVERLQQRVSEMQTAVQFLNWECRWQRKRILLISLLVVFGMSIAGVAVADEMGGFDTQKLIGISGAAPSNLVIGMNEVSNSWLDIALGGAHFHEDDPAFAIVSLAPLIYAAMLIFVLVGLFTSLSLKTIIFGVVAIYIAIALLTGMQISITDLLR